MTSEDNTPNEDFIPDWDFEPRKYPPWCYPDWNPDEQRIDPAGDDNRPWGPAATSRRLEAETAEKRRRRPKRPEPKTIEEAEARAIYDFDDIGWG